MKRRDFLTLGGTAAAAIAAAALTRGLSTKHATRDVGMKYYLGPWRWTGRTNTFAAFLPPEGTVGSIDFRSIPNHAGGADQQGGLFASTKDLGDDYTLLGSGDLRDIKPDGAALSAWEHATGFKPTSATIADWIAETLQNGDPLGLDRCKPIQPTMDNKLELWLPGHGLVKSEAFKWDVHPLTNKLQALLRADFERIFQEFQAAAQAKTGAEKTKLEQFPQRVLDFTQKKLGVIDWRELVPASLQNEISGPLPHETTVTDDFNRADNTTVGNDSLGNAWVEVSGGNWKIASNALTFDTGGGDPLIRNGTSLSSADHYTQADITTLVTSNDQVVWGRATSDFANGYGADVHAANGAITIFKVVAGSGTVLATVGKTIGAATWTTKLTCNGSAMTLLVGATTLGPTTDTSVTGNLRTGLSANGSVSAIYDNYVAADLGGAPAARTSDFFRML